MHQTLYSLGSPAHVVAHKCFRTYFVRMCSAPICILKQQLSSQHRCARANWCPTNAFRRDSISVHFPKNICIDRLVRDSFETPLILFRTEPPQHTCQCKHEFQIFAMNFNDCGGRVVGWKNRFRRTKRRLT